MTEYFKNGWALGVWVRGWNVLRVVGPIKEGSGKVA